MGSSWKYLGAAKWCKPKGFTVQNACLGGLCDAHLHLRDIMRNAYLGGTTQRVVGGRK